MKTLFLKILKLLSAVPSEIPKLRLHVSDTAISFEDNYILSVISFDGLVFESISDNVLQNDFEALSLAYAETAKEKAGRLSFYTYQLRRKVDTDKAYRFDNGFCQNFADKYLKRFNDSDYFANRYYIVFTLKYDGSISDAISELFAVCDRFSKTLGKYSPKILSAYTNESGVLASEIFEFFYEIINSEQTVGCCPIAGSPAYDVLPAVNMHFGFELLQINGTLKDRFAYLLNLKDFPYTTKLGMFNSSTLALPFEFNFVQSFVALAPVSSLEFIDRRLNELRSVKDKAQHQQDELELAQGYIQSGEMAMGHYHAVLVVFGDSQKQALENAVTAMASFSNNAGAVFRKAMAASAPSYFSQLPNYRYIPRRMVKSTHNLAGTFSMHNYSRGKATGNPLGDGTAIIPLQTLSKTLYDFNFHFSNELEDNTGEAIAGHTLILGATGTGKTTLQSALVTFTQRFNPAVFVLDKDRGMDILLRALNGDYFAIEEGVPTGINPFQFKDSPRLREFLNDLVVSIANDTDTKCSSEEQNQIKAAIDTVMSLPLPLRRLSALMQSIPSRGGNSLHARLTKWCRTDENVGRFAWVLDNPKNIFDPDDFKIVGFDVGAILKENYQPTEPLLACLLYLKSEMAKNHPLLCTIVEEFWLPLMYETPQRMMLDVLKTGRKRGEFMVMVTQSPEEAVASPIFPAIVQQTPTKVLLPNPDAEYENKQGGGYSRIGLTQKEFNKLKRLALDSRTALVKQGHQSSFVVFDLYGFSDEINILSSTSQNVELLEQLFGYFDVIPPSEIWIPLFYEAVRERKKGGFDVSEFMQIQTSIDPSLLKAKENGLDKGVDDA